MRLLSVVITYFPNIENTIQNIESYIDHVDCLIIWENTPEQYWDKYRVILPKYKKKILYMGNGSNELIAFPLNQCITYAKSNGFSHLMSMDQDSKFEQNHFAKYKQIINDFKPISIFGPNPNYRDFKNVGALTEVKHLITSGCIYNLEIFKTVSGFNEDYKIDCVDYEFCLRARLFGIKCFMVSEILLVQQFGEQKKSIFGFYSSNYSAFRLYYIVRNNFYLHKDFPENYSLISLLNFLFKLISKIIISEKHKFKKILSIIKGINHGCIYKK